DVTHPAVAALRGARSGGTGIVHLSAAGVDADVTGVPDEVAGLGLRLGDHRAGCLLGTGAARQVDADVAVDPRGVCGAVPAALRGSTVDIGGADALGRPGQDLLGLGTVDRAGVGGVGVRVRGVGVLALLLVRVGRAAVGSLSGGTGRITGFFSGGFAGGGLRLGFRSSLGLDGLGFDAERIGLLLGLLVLRVITDGHGLVLELDLRLSL